MNESPMLCVVGKFYQVPCILALPRAWCGKGFVPIVGPLHDDQGPINFPHPHWHIDWRFVSAKISKRACWYSGTPYSRVLQEKTAYLSSELFIDPVVESTEVTMRRMKCMREPPAYPIKAAKWLPELNKEFSGCKAKDGICPHRGLPLVGHTADGVTTCPGHGMRWRVDTGDLVTA